METRLFAVILLVSMTIVAAAGCKKKSSASSDNSIASVKIDGEVVCNGDDCSASISHLVCKTTNIAQLTPEITLSDNKAKIDKAGPQDFTNPVVYTVTAEDGSAKKYTISVTRTTDPCNN